MHKVRLAAVAALALALTAGTKTPANEGGGSLAVRLRGLRVAAHRGGGYGFPDSNTLARFEMTRAQGVDIIETDLRLSKDGVVFLFHNALLDRVTSCTGPFESRTAAEIGRCHLTGLDRGPDRFEDALKWSRGRVVLDAELKVAEVTRPAIDLVRRYNAYDWVYFQVGNGMRRYRDVREYDKRVAVEASPRGPRGDHWLAKLLAARDPNLVLIQLHPNFCSPEIVRKVHSSQKLTSLNAFQLAPEETDATCVRVFELGVDVAVTNSVEHCLRQRDEARAAAGKAAPAAPARHED